MSETPAKTRARAISKQRKKDAGFQPRQFELLPEAYEHVKKYALKKNKEFSHLHPGSEKYL